MDEDRLRTFEVKIAAAKDERGRAAIVALLVGTRGRGPDKTLAMERLAAWSAADPGDGLPLYLIGRHYFGAGQFEEAAERLDRALAARIALPRVAIEAARLRMITACGLGDKDRAAALFQRYAGLRRRQRGPASRGGGVRPALHGGGDRCPRGRRTGDNAASARSRPWTGSRRR